MRLRDLPALKRVVLGAVAGAFIGFICLIAGAVRILRFESRGGEIQPVTTADAGEMALYVVAFAIGGAFVGAVQPLLRTRAAVYRAAATAGAIVMIGVVSGVDGIERMSTLWWILAVCLGASSGSRLPMAGTAPAIACEWDHPTFPKKPALWSRSCDRFGGAAHA
jgi:hypothetical protein